MKLKRGASLGLLFLAAAFSAIITFYDEPIKKYREEINVNEEYTEIIQPRKNDIFLDNPDYKEDGIHGHASKIKNLTENGSIEDMSYYIADYLLDEGDVMAIPFYGDDIIYYSTSVKLPGGEASLTFIDIDCDGERGDLDTLALNGRMNGMYIDVLDFSLNKINHLGIMDYFYIHSTDPRIGTFRSADSPHSSPRRACSENPVEIDDFSEFINDIYGDFLKNSILELE